MKKLSLLILSFISIFNITAQEEDAVKDLLNNYVEAMNNLSKTKNEKDVTQYFHKNYRNYNAELGLSGIVNRKNSDLDEFSDKIQDIISNKNYNLTLSIEKILYVNQRSKVGTIAALINFENKLKSKIADKGTILLNLIASKATGDWEIMHTNTTRISESKDVGRCSCHIYNKGTDSNRYVSEVYYPAGLEILQQYQSFRVAIKKGKRYIISDNSEFIWENDGENLYDGETLLGKAKDIKAAIKLILAKEYTDTCIEMIMI